MRANWASPRMNLSSFMGEGWVHGPQLLHDDEGILLCRACREGVNGERKFVLAACSRPRSIQHRKVLIASHTNLS